MLINSLFLTFLFVHTIKFIKYNLKSWKKHLAFIYTVFDVVMSPGSLAKSWSLGKSFNKILYKNFSIKNYFKKDILNFSFHEVRDLNHQTTIQFFFISSSVCFCKLSMKLVRAISSSSSCASDYLKSIAFSSL